MEKIKQQGSLYGVPESKDDVSPEVAERRQSGWINSARKIFNREPLSAQYNLFIETAIDNLDSIGEQSMLSGAGASQSPWKKATLREADQTMLTNDTNWITDTNNKKMV